MQSILIASVLAFSASFPALTSAYNASAVYGCLAIFSIVPPNLTINKQPARNQGGMVP
jgi:hypothetical protein